MNQIVLFLWSFISQAFFIYLRVLGTGLGAGSPSGYWERDPVFIEFVKLREENEYMSKNIADADEWRKETKLGGCQGGVRGL